MAGLYIHIPFCKSRCIYCGFYSTTAAELRSLYAAAVCRELYLRRNYICTPINTIYFGGGTPSLLSPEDRNRIFDCIYKYYKVETKGLEVTFECNPDDVTEEFARNIATSPVNRVSMGGQSFSDDILRFVHRRHTAGQTAIATERLRNAGIGNISLDLIFGFPEEGIKTWKADIRQALQIAPEHISAYSLTYEEGTPLFKMLKEGKAEETDDDTYLRMYDTLIDSLTASGYEHYEISNFAKPGFRSRHNSGYWQGTPYLGAGSAAHSFDGTSRQWNVADVRKYMEAIENDTIPAEKETLTTDQRFDDMVMTRLRTAEGIELDRVRNDFGEEYLEFLLSEAKPHIRGGRLETDKEKGTLKLTRKGIFVSDGVMSDLMHV